MDKNINNQALIIQLLITFLSISIFFVPFGEVSDLSYYYLISTPYSIIIIGLLFLSQLFYVFLNYKNGASFESSYFLSTAFFPLISFIYHVFVLVEFKNSYLLQYSYIIVVSLISFIIIVYYALRVDQRYSLRRVSRANSISVNATPVIGIIILTVLFFLYETFNYFNFNYFNGGESYLLWRYWYSYVLIHLAVGGIYTALYFLNQSSIIINIKDRLFLYVSLAISSFIFSLWLYEFNIIESVNYIVDVGFVDFSETFGLIYNFILLFVFPIVRIILGYYLVNQQSLAHEQGAAGRTESINNASYNSINYDEDDSSSSSEFDTHTRQTPETNQSYFSKHLTFKERFTQSKIVIVGTMFFMVFVYTIAFNSNFIAISGFEELAYSFNDLADLLEFLELLANESNNVQVLISFYVILMYALQLSTIVMQVFGKSSFKSPSFITFSIVQSIHLILIIYLYNGVNQFYNELFEVFNLEVTVVPGFGMLLQIGLFILGIVLIVKGDELSPKLITQFNGFNKPANGYYANRSLSSDNSNDPYWQDNGNDSIDNQRERNTYETMNKQSDFSDRIEENRNTSKSEEKFNSEIVRTPINNANTEVKSSIEEKMLLIKKLYETGQITEEEYSKKREDLLNRI